jgi:hypothetical protein
MHATSNLWQPAATCARKIIWLADNCSKGGDHSPAAEHAMPTTAESIFLNRLQAGAQSY